MSSKEIQAAPPAANVHLAQVDVDEGRDQFPLLVVVVSHEYVGHRVQIILNPESWPHVATQVLETNIDPDDWKSKLPVLERLFSYGRLMEKQKRR
jgi:hypothetical protein